MPPNAISSLWLPRSAMPEGVNTTISFALFMVESLCATIMQVRPLASSKSSCCISISVWLSRAEVASSSIRMRGFLRKMRASAIRLR